MNANDLSIWGKVSCLCFTTKIRLVNIQFITKERLFETLFRYALIISLLTCIRKGDNNRTIVHNVHQVHIVHTVLCCQGEHTNQ